MILQTIPVIPLTIPQRVLEAWSSFPPYPGTENLKIREVSIVNIPPRNKSYCKRMLIYTRRKIFQALPSQNTNQCLKPANAKRSPELSVTNYMFLSCSGSAEHFFADEIENKSVYYRYHYPGDRIGNYQIGDGAVKREYAKYPEYSECTYTEYGNDHGFYRVSESAQRTADRLHYTAEKISRSHDFQSDHSPLDDFRCRIVNAQ